MNSLRGPNQSPVSLVVVCAAAIIFGALVAALGAVVHSGGIDGGPWGIVVALASALAGGVTFALLGGVVGWLCYAVAGVVVALWALTRSGFDIIDTGGGLTVWWQIGLPVAIIAGGMLGAGIGARTERRRGVRRAGADNGDGDVSMVDTETDRGGVEHV